VLASRIMAKKKGISLFKLAAIGSLIAWLYQRRRKSRVPEGTWREVTFSDGSSTGHSG
jgi:hypothetical protein